MLESCAENGFEENGLSGKDQQMRKQRYQKILPLFMAGLLVWAGGCTPKEASAPVESAPESKAYLENSGEEETLILAQWSLDRSGISALEEIAEKYGADYPQTQVEILTLENEEALLARLQGGEQIDLCELTGETAGSLVRQGSIKELSPYLETWLGADTLSSTAKQAVEQLCLLPCSVKQEALYYRKDLFDGIAVTINGKLVELPVPGTWEEVDLAVKNLPEDCAGLAVSGGEGLLDLLDAVLWSNAGLSGVESSNTAAYYLADGKTIFSLERTEKAMSLFTSLIKADVPSEALSWTEEEALNAFLEGKTAMLLADRTASQKISQELPENAWGVTGYPSGAMGKAVLSSGFTGWGIPVSGASAETAAHFLFFLSSDDNNTHFAKVMDEMPIHISAPLVDSFFKEPRRKVFVEMATQGEKYKPAAIPARYEAYEGFREEADARIRQTLSGELSEKELLSWLDDYWQKAYEQEGKLWKEK